MLKTSHDMASIAYKRGHRLYTFKISQENKIKQVHEHDFLTCHARTDTFGEARGVPSRHQLVSFLKANTYEGHKGDNLASH